MVSAYRPVYDTGLLAGLRAILFGLPAALTLWAAMALEASVKWPRWAVWAGNASYSIYLWNFPAISALLAIWPRGTWLGLVTYWPAAMGLALALGWTSWRIVERTSTRATKSPAQWWPGFKVALGDLGASGRMWRLASPSR